MKKSIALLLAALMIIGCFSVISASAATSKITLVDNKYVEGAGYQKTETVYEPEVGTTAIYTCSIQCPKIIEDGQFLLMYDNSVLKAVEVNVPNIPEAIYNPDFSNPSISDNYLTDRVKLNFTRFKGIDFTTEDVLFTVKFEVISEGSGKIELKTDPSEVIPSESKINEAIVISDTDDESVVKLTTINQKLEINAEPATSPTESTSVTASSETDSSSETQPATDTTATETSTETPSETATADPSATTIPDSPTQEPSETQSTEPSESESVEPTQTSSETEATDPSGTAATEPSETKATSVTDATETRVPEAPTTAPATKATTPKATSAPKINTFKGNPSVASAENLVKSLKNDKDPSGSTFCLLKAKAVKVSKSAVKVSWSKVKGAAGYIIYGNKCGKSYKYITKTSSTKFTQRKLKKGTYYKYLILAYNSKDKVVAVSKTIHAATKGGKVGNAKSVKFTNVKSKYSIKKGKIFTLKTKVTPQSKKLKIKNHRKTAFESSNAKIVKVNSKGKIKGLKKGSAYIYAYAQNGVAAKVKVTVK